MTARELYEGTLIELATIGAPSLLIDEYNYYINKAVYQYTNKQYNIFEETQQSSDNLQVLKGSTSISGNKIKPLDTADSDIIIPANTVSGPITIKRAKYSVKLPADYYHILNCILTYNVEKTFKCYNLGYKIQTAAKRITADAMANVINNAWLKPSPKQPYYFVQNNERAIAANWAARQSEFDNARVKETFINKKAGNTNAHNAWEDSEINPVNPTFTSSQDGAIGPNMEIDFGKDRSIFSLYSVDINYLKVPQMIRLTPDQIDMTADESQILEFPEYVCREIIKENVLLILAHTGNPKLQYYATVNNTNPAPAQQAPAGK